MKKFYKGNVKKNNIHFMYLAGELNLLSYIAYRNYKENIQDSKISNNQANNQTETKTTQSNNMASKTIENFDITLKSKEFMNLWDKLPLRVKYLVNAMN